MRIVIPAINIKVFGKAVQSLAKLGEEISFEPLLTGLSLKAINPTRSCLAVYELKARFFQHYKGGSDDGGGDEPGVRFRVSSKGVLHVFKSLNSMDRTVETCSIHLDEDQNRVVFTLICKHGITKTHSLTYMEGESLSCSLAKGSCANVIKAEPKLFTEILTSFPNSLEEMTLIVNSTGASLRNFVDAEVAADPLKLINTTMTLHQDEFDVYHVTNETSVSFCLKEMKAALSFAEYTNINIALYFDCGGQPMFVNMDSDPNFEVTFIASTISESLSQQSSSAAAVSQTSSRPANPVAAKSGVTSQAPNPPPRKPDNKKFLGKLETSLKPRPLVVCDGADRDLSADSDRTALSGAQIEGESEVKVRPKVSALMNDTSITLLPAEKSTSKRKTDVDALLDEIASDTLTTTSSVKKKKMLFLNQSKPAAPRPQADEVLADDSDDD